MFNVWMNLHGKTYSDLGEKQYHMRIWLENYAYVQAHNARHAAGEETYELEMNQFADLTSEEFGEKYLMLNNPPTDPEVTKECTGSQAPDTNLPASVDWSAKGILFFNFRCCFQN